MFEVAAQTPTAERVINGRALARVAVPPLSIACCELYEYKEFGSFVCFEETHQASKKEMKETGGVTSSQTSQLSN